MRSVLWLVLTLVAACAPRARPAATPLPTRPPAPAPKPKPAEPTERPPFAVVSDCAPATRAARAMLERGGNAIDAAVAAVLIAGVVHPSASGLGGGGLAVVADGPETTAIDFRGPAPDPLDPEAVERGHIDGDRAALVAIPGEVAGLWRLHRRGGALPWSELFGPAITAAREGFVVSAYLGRAMRHARRWLRDSPLQPVLAPGGALIEVGDRTPGWPALAETLERVASRGEGGFYEGPVAESVLAVAGGRIEAGALRPRVSSTEPTTTAFGEVEILTPPSRGGVLLAGLLRLQGPDAWERVEGDDRIHLLAESSRLMRHHLLTSMGPDSRPETLLAPDRLESIRKRIDPERRTPLPAGAEEAGGTTGVLVLDGEGRAVAVSTSLGHSFGARLVTQSGIVLNDHLSAFFRPHQIRRFGRGGAPRSGRRPPSSLAPMLARRDDRVMLAASASGGEHIPTAILQTLLAAWVDEAEPAEAVRRPRIRAPIAGGLWLVPALDAHAPALRRRGHHVRLDVPAFDAVQVFARRGDALRAAADPRKGGAIAIR